MDSTTERSYAIPEVAELHQLRLDLDLTLEELAEQIRQAGWRIDASTLSRLFSDPEREPFERTRHKIRRFLADHKSGKRTRKAVSR
jgi:hypothetical protein